MTPETGEQLNEKWHTLHGWTRPGRRWHQPDCGPNGNCKGYDELPALHLDANLAIEEADRVFSGGWAITRFFYDTPQEPRVRIWTTGRSTNGLYGEGPHAFCEAILKALIATKEKR